MKNKLNSLRVKFPIITFFTYLALVITVLTACYLRINKDIIDSYKDTAREILSLASDDIQKDNIKGYLNGEYNSYEYDRTKKRLNKYILYYNNISYLYAYNFDDDSLYATVIFDTDAADGSMMGDELGTKYELEPAFIKNIDAFRRGEQVGPMIDRSSWGYLMTCSKPLIDSDGVCQGYIFVDFDLSQMQKSNIHYITNLSVLVFLLMLVILYLGMRAVSIRITSPIEKIYLCLKGFSYGSDEEKEQNIENLKALNIHTNQEIQTLYETLVSTIENSYKLQHDFDETSAKVYIDSLTGLGNKNGYERQLKEYQELIDEGKLSNLAIAVADINNLKYVNDTYGHEKGDKYIEGCGKIMAEIFGSGNVFRTGGDEFVIFMGGVDFSSRYILLDKAEERFKANMQNESLKEYKRYSASLGIACYKAGDQKTLPETVKEADKQMYEKKNAFKEQYGSYR